MVTKPTGKPRGRPRKERRPSNPIGRPPVSFLKDPDRYHVALLEALLALDGVYCSANPSRKPASLRTCSWIAAAWDVGQEVKGPFFKRRTVRDVTLFGRRDDPGSFVGFKGTKAAHGVAATIDGRARTLRKKYKEACAPEEINWRGNVAACLMLGLAPSDELEKAKLKVLKHADWAGERDFAIKVIFPMIESKLASPE